MQNYPRPGIKPVSSALAGRFLSPGSAGKSTPLLTVLLKLPQVGQCPLSGWLLGPGDMPPPFFPLCALLLLSYTRSPGLLSTLLAPAQLSAISPRSLDPFSEDWQSETKICERLLLFFKGIETSLDQNLT